jgi:DNA-binding MarR family transcriptional regulator
MSLPRVSHSRKAAQRKQLIHLALVSHFMLQLSLAGDADARLKGRSMGRVHHRILYFAHFSPGIEVGELLSALDVRHQNIQRPLRKLVKDGYIFTRQKPNDGRIKQLYSSRKGDKLLEFVGAAQRERIGRAYDRVTLQDVRSYLNVMAEMLEPDRRGWIHRLIRLDDPTECV